MGLKHLLLSALIAVPASAGVTGHLPALAQPGPGRFIHDARLSENVPDVCFTGVWALDGSRWDHIKMDEGQQLLVASENLHLISGLAELEGEPGAILKATPDGLVFSRLPSAQLYDRAVELNESRRAQGPNAPLLSVALLDPIPETDFLDIEYRKNCRFKGDANEETPCDFQKSKDCICLYIIVPNGGDDDGPVEVFIPSVKKRTPSGYYVFELASSGEARCVTIHLDTEESAGVAIRAHTGDWALLGGTLFQEYTGLAATLVHFGEGDSIGFYSADQWLVAQGDDLRIPRGLDCQLITPPADPPSALGLDVGLKANCKQSHNPKEPPCVSCDPKVEKCDCQCVYIVEPKTTGLPGSWSEFFQNFVLSPPAGGPRWDPALFLR